MFHILPVFCAFPSLPLNAENFVFLSVFQCLASQDAHSFLGSHMAPVCLEGLWDSLLASRQHFLSEDLFSCFPSGVSHMAGAISPAGPQHMVSVQLYRAIVPSQRYMIPKILLRTHKQDTSISSLLWLDAAPPPEKHMVDCVHSAPYWRFFHKPRFWTTWLAFKVANFWRISTIPFLF